MNDRAVAKLHQEHLRVYDILRIGRRKGNEFLSPLMVSFAQNGHARPADKILPSVITYYNT
jgi:hypothetical protein